MAQAKLNKRTVDALTPPKAGQVFIWDTEIKGFGVRIGQTGTKTFVIQYMNKEGRIRRVKIGRFGVITVDQARDLAKIKLGEVASGEDPAEEARRVRKEMTVTELCDWYLAEARAGRILGRKNRPIKESSLAMDESRIKTHIKPLIGKRIARHLTIADVEAMQDDVKNHKTQKSRSGGRGGKATGGPGVAARCLGTIQAILGHARHKGLLSEHPTKGAKKLAGNKKTRRLSVAEIETLGKAMVYAEQQGVSPTGISVIKLLLLTGYRREEGQAMERAWVNPMGGFVAFPDTKTGGQIRAIGPEAIKVIVAQPQVAGNPHVFPATTGDGPFTAASACLQRICGFAGIVGVTPHTLRHTFASIAAELGFSELTIRAMLGHASQNVTQDYIHVDEALKLAVRRTSDEIAKLLAQGAAKLDRLRLVA
ncbi:site-specific integrase [Sphingobium sp. 3R8]|uniref:tyrosine-type recombinase/integrase n=1 Tax=Sphingobium sp. 3R8 TaxID=2874921 RepID=UPI001CCAA4C4|nr:site-specific integrase [Sphingobium sp. 3R8]MBZ9648140.1 site-specific integrase [Sphingobium sp. 3R8]